MGKSILISVKGRHAINIIKGIKLLELRKKFPKDFKGWVYIYISKHHTKFDEVYVWEDVWVTRINGLVVGKFWCEDVYNVCPWIINGKLYNGNYENNLLKQTCLCEEELIKYLPNGYGLALKITKFHFFKKPKELKDYNISKAPQSWCYIKGN